MTPRRPPTLANWLLERLGNVSLTGDLLEEFAGGRSAVWFWRQTVVAVFVTLTRRADRLLNYPNALAIGLGVQVYVAILLWRAGIPSPIHGAGPIALASFLLLLAFLAPYVGWALLGKSSNDLRVMPAHASGETAARRPLLAGMVAVETFTTLLGCYFICALIGSYSSELQIAGYDLIWVGAGEFAGVGLRAFHRYRSRRRGQPAPIFYPPLDKLRLEIAGATKIISLDPGTCIEELFASADVEFVRAIFTGGTSREQIRRAIFAACSKDPIQPRPIPLREFAALVRKSI